MLTFFRMDVITTVNKCKLLLLENKYFQSKEQVTVRT